MAVRSFLWIPVVVLVFLGSTLAWSSNPVVMVASPTSGLTSGSPVHYVASASSASCSRGISAMRIYSSPRVSVYTVNANHLDVSVNLLPGTYNSVIQAWDNCGGVGKANVLITVIAPPRFFYMTQSPNGTVQGFALSPTDGSPAPISQGSVPAHKTPLRVISDKGGYRLYVANAGSNDISAYFINRNNGSLAPVPGSPFAVGQPPRDIAVSPSGKFVYVSVGRDGPGDGVDAFRVNSDGSLSLIAGSPFPTQNDPHSIVVDPTGRFLYTLDRSSLSLDAFGVNWSSGALTPLLGSPYHLSHPLSFTPCGFMNPADLAVDPTGTHLYVAEAGTDAVAGYTIDYATGMLSEINGSPFIDSPCGGGTGNPVSISIEPHGKYLIAFDTGNAQMTTFAITPNTGSLSVATRTPPNTGNATGGDMARVDPSGKFVYFLGVSAHAVILSGFAIDQSNGNLLQPTWGSDLVVGNVNPSIDGIAVTP